MSLNRFHLVDATAAFVERRWFVGIVDILRRVALKKSGQDAGFPSMQCVFVSCSCFSLYSFKYDTVPFLKMVSKTITGFKVFVTKFKGKLTRFFRQDRAINRHIQCALLGKPNCKGPVAVRCFLMELAVVARQSSLIFSFISCARSLIQYWEEACTSVIILHCADDFPRHRESV